MGATGLRERKKRETHMALARAAQELVREHRLEDVTIEQIAAAADVSPRTFFNHFSCKEEAVVGLDPALVAELGDELRRRPEGESPREALRAVLVETVDAEEMLRRWELRNQLVCRYPALLPWYLESMVQIEEALAEAVAERLGVDTGVDPLPRVLAAASLAVLRATLAWWSEDREGNVALRDVLERTFTAVVADGRAR